MKIEKAIKRLIELYHKAEKTVRIKDKTSWALYQVWKEAEDDRRRKDQDG